VWRATPLNSYPETTMATFDELYGSRFLSATDLKGPVTATIERVEEETFARDGKPARPKAVLYFKNAKKGVVLNKTNANVLAQAFGKDMKKWPGKRTDIKPETTIFGGKPVPALRLYPASNGDAHIAPPEPPPPEPPPLRDEMNDEIGF
jgi:hypothetical protein